GLRVEPERAGRKVVATPHHAWADGVGVEHHEIRDRSYGEATAPAQAVEISRRARDHGHSLLEGGELVVAGCRQEGGRCIERGDHVEVRARVGATDGHARVAQDLRAQAPCGVVTAGNRWLEAGAQILVTYDVEEHVDGTTRLLVGDLADTPARIGGVPRRNR